MLVPCMAQAFFLEFFARWHVHSPSPELLITYVLPQPASVNFLPLRVLSFLPATYRTVLRLLPAYVTSLVPSLILNRLDPPLQ